MVKRISQAKAFQLMKKGKFIVRSHNNYWETGEDLKTHYKAQNIYLAKKNREEKERQ